MFIRGSMPHVPLPDTTTIKSSALEQGRYRSKKCQITNVRGWNCKGETRPLGTVVSQNLMIITEESLLELQWPQHRLVWRPRNPSPRHLRQMVRLRLNMKLAPPAWGLPVHHSSQPHWVVELYRRRRRLDRRRERRERRRMERSSWLDDFPSPFVWEQVEWEGAPAWTRVVQSEENGVTVHQLQVRYDPPTEE